MHHVIVTRVSISLTVLLSGLVLGFAFVVNTPSGPVSSGDTAEHAPPGHDGASLYEQHCATCHAAGELRAPLHEAPDPEALKQEWLVLLDSHGRASSDEDRRILEYLEAGK